MKCASREIIREYTYVNLSIIQINNTCRTWQPAAAAAERGQADTGDEVERYFGADERNAIETLAIC